MNGPGSRARGLFGAAGPALVLTLGLLAACAPQQSGPTQAAGPGRSPGETPQVPDFAALAVQPGTEVRRERVNDEEIVTVRRGGVEIRYGRSGSTGVDSNGIGMLCLWRHALLVKSLMDFCQVPESSLAQTELNGSIDALNDFVAVNGLVPRPRAEVEAAAAGYKAVPENMRRMPAGEREARCRSVLAPGQLAGNVLQSPREYRAMVAQQVALPRPPVMNPCF